MLLEGLRQSHNYSAVLRSCDAFGVQDVHLVDPDAQFEINADVSLGSDKWLSMHSHASLDGAIATLRSGGYRIVATSPHPPSTPLPDLDVSQPLVLVFGNELRGLSDAALALADERVAIPMHGLVESFNVSVAAALCLYDLTRRLRQAGRWQLDPDAREALLMAWVRRSITACGRVEEEFLARWDEERSAAGA